MRNRAVPSGQSFSCLVLGQHVRVEYTDVAVGQLLVGNFGAMAAPGECSPADLQYSVHSRGTPPRFSLSREGHSLLHGADLGDLLFWLEKDLTVELQKRRAGLFFLHSAAIDWQGKTCLIAAESGRGKSTTTWALLHHGFAYLSDELSPVDLQSMQVFPYPHALCLKRRPPAYPLPADAIHLGRTIHVPARSLPSWPVSEPRPLGALLLVSYCPDLDAPEVRAISSAEASARLYVNVLNALAHPCHGLDGAVRIAEHVPCYAVSSAALPATCALIRTTLEQATAGGFGVRDGLALDPLG